MKSTNTYQVMNRAYGIAALCEKLGVARPTIWRRLKDDPTFPRPLTLGGRSRRWLDTEVDNWIATKAAERKAVK